MPPARPDERRQPQPIGVHAGRRGRARSARPSSGWSRPRSTRSTWTRTPASTRASARSTSSRSCRSATRRWTTASSSPGRSGSGSRTGSSCRSTCTPRPRTRPDRVKLADVRRGQYEGLKAEIDAARPRARLRAGPDAPVGRRGRRRRPPVPHRLQHQPRRRATSSSRKRIARRVRESGGGLPEVQANGFWIEELGRAQVSMNLLDFEITPLWLVWETVRELAAEDGVELAESELIGLAPLARSWPSPTTPARRATRRSRSGSRAAAAFLQLRDFSPLQALELRLEAARDRLGPAERHRAMSGGSGSSRAAGPTSVTPGLLVVGAAEVATLAGGVRAGRDPGRRRPAAAADGGRPGRARRPGRRVLGGPHRRRRAAADGRGGARGRRATRSGGSPGSTPRGGTVTPGPRRPAHPPAVRRHARGRARPAPARRRLPRDPRRGRRDPLDGRGDPGRDHATTCSPTAGAGSTRCSATASRRSRRSPATGSTSRPSCGCSRSPTGSGGEGPIDVVPTYLGAHAVAARVPRAARTGPRPTSASVIEEQLPGVAAQGRARFCDVFCEEGVFTADQSRRILTAAAGFGLAPAPPRRRARRRPAARSWRPSSAPRRPTTSRRRRTPGIDGAGRPRPTTDRPVVATLLPATTWFLMKDHHAPARTFIERGVPVAIGTDFNPGHVADGQPAAGDDRSPASSCG